MTARRISQQVATAGALLLVALASFALAPAHAGAQESCEMDENYEGTAVVGVVGDSEVAPGETVTLEGSGFPADCLLDIVVNGNVVGTVVTDGSGNFSTGVTLGSNITGTITIGVAAGAFSRTVALQVETTTTTTVTPATTVTTVAAAPLTTAGQLPRTGADSSLLLSVGLALVAVGGLAVIGARRRNATV